MATLMVAMSFSRKPANDGNLTVIFDHYVGDSLLRLDDKLYKNEIGQSFSVTKFKYYVGNICLKKAGGGKVSFQKYYLINEEEVETKKIDLDVQKGVYTGIDFIIGVDSIDNCSGAQSGALDPVNAMFWAWNTGYIFLKMEGKASASTSPGHIYEYHIGGYRQPYNCVRHVSLTFNKPLEMATTSNKAMHIKADAGKILGGDNNIDFSKLSSVTDFHNSTVIADNYAEMFSILAISNGK